MIVKNKKELKANKIVLLENILEHELEIVLMKLQI